MGRPYRDRRNHGARDDRAYARHGDLMIHSRIVSAHCEKLFPGQKWLREQAHLYRSHSGRRQA